MIDIMQSYRLSLFEAGKAGDATEQSCVIVALSRTMEIQKEIDAFYVDIEKDVLAAS